MVLLMGSIVRHMLCALLDCDLRISAVVFTAGRTCVRQLALVLELVTNDGAMCVGNVCGRFVLLVVLSFRMRC